VKEKKKSSHLLIPPHEEKGGEGKIKGVQGEKKKKVQRSSSDERGEWEKSGREFPLNKRKRGV